MKPLFFALSLAMTVTAAADQLVIETNTMGVILSHKVEILSNSGALVSYDLTGVHVALGEEPLVNVVNENHQNCVLVSATLVGTAVRTIQQTRVVGFSPSTREIREHVGQSNVTERTVAVKMGEAMICQKHIDSEYNVVFKNSSDTQLATALYKNDLTEDINRAFAATSETKPR